MTSNRHAEHLLLPEAQLPDPDSRIAIETRVASLPDLERWIEQLSVQFDLTPPLRNRIEVCLTELMTNLICYGYPEGCVGSAKMTFWRHPDRYAVCIEDDGRPFDPTTYVLPAQPNSLQEANASGRGIQLVRQFADTLQYHRHDGGNQLVLSFQQTSLPGAAWRQAKANRPA